MSSPATPSAVSAPAATPVVRASSSSTQWDRCLENGALKSVYGGAMAAIASAVLFRSGSARLAAIGFGAGTGAGMAWFECKHAYAPSRFHNSLLTPAANAVVQSQAASSTLPRCGKATCKCGANCKCTPAGFASVSNGILPTFNVDEKKGGCCSS